jgi:altronate dehydratase large subunit
MTFWGYRRPERDSRDPNHVLIVATVGCAAEVARVTAENLYGAVSFINQNGAD